MRQDSAVDRYAPMADAGRGGRGDPDHVVQFYRTDDFLTGAVTRWVSEALGAGDAALVIGTATLRRAVVDRLDELGGAVGEAVRTGRLVQADSAETLARFCTGWDVGVEGFESAVVPLVERALERSESGRVRAYGDMVDLLWRDGRVQAAIETERLWNRLQTRHGFSLLCGYRMGDLKRRPRSVGEICHQHTRVAPAEDDVDGHPSAEAVLLAEIAEREETERALRGALDERRQLEEDRRVAMHRMERITRITGAIAVAVTPEEVYEAVVDNVAASLGASSAGLWMVRPESRVAALVRSIGYSEDVDGVLTGVPLDAPDRFPALDAMARGEPVWLDSLEELVEGYPNLTPYLSGTRQYAVACLPVGVPGRTVGCLALTFENAPSLDLERRDLLLLVARYTGQALERLRLLQDTMEARLRAELLHGLARAVITAERVEPVYEAALDAIALGLGATRASVLSFDEEGVMRFRAWRGLSDEYRSAVEGHSPWSPNEEDAEPIFVPDVEQEPRLSGFLSLFLREEIGALAFVPLVAGGRLLGKFMVYYDVPRSVSESELATARAIADHVAAAMDRFDSLAELQRTLRFNEMFAGVLGHDLRNPLSAIMTAAQILLLKGAGDERSLRPVTRIVSSGERMSRMIDQLLDFSRIRLGSGLPLERREVDIVRLLRQVTEELEMANPDALIRLQHEGNAEGWWDEDRLGQLFSNLVGNAVQHGTADRPVIVRVDVSGGPVVVHVHNEGIIPAEILARLFEPMPSGERRWGDSQGLGLGLCIAQQIATAHAGTIQVDSSEVRGTTFTVTLPRDRGRGGTRIEP